MDSQNASKHRFLLPQLRSEGPVKMQLNLEAQAKFYLKLPEPLELSRAALHPVRLKYGIIPGWSCGISQGDDGYLYTVNTG